MRKRIIVVLLAFVITLAIVVGNRMSAEAMAVVIGVVCGVAASIPMSLLITLAINGNRRKVEGEEWFYTQSGGRYGVYPPVVVIQGGVPTSNTSLPPYYPTQAIMSEPVQRQFRIFGEHEN